MKNAASVSHYTGLIRQCMVRYNLVFIPYLNVFGIETFNNFLSDIEGKHYPITYCLHLLS